MRKGVLVSSSLLGWSDAWISSLIWLLSTYINCSLERDGIWVSWLSRVAGRRLKAWALLTLELVAREEYSTQVTAAHQLLTLRLCWSSHFATAKYYLVVWLLSLGIYLLEIDCRVGCLVLALNQLLRIGWQCRNSVQATEPTQNCTALSSGQLRSHPATQPCKEFSVYQPSDSCSHRLQGKCALDWAERNNVRSFLEWEHPGVAQPLAGIAKIQASTLTAGWRVRWQVRFWQSISSLLHCQTYKISKIKYLSIQAKKPRPFKIL